MRRRDLRFDRVWRQRLPLLATAWRAQAKTEEPVKRNGRFKQGITRGVFGQGDPAPTVEYCCREAAGWASGDAIFSIIPMIGPH